MSSVTPFFSIVIPTYNRAHLIDKTIKSILAQEFIDYEVIVIDDGSTDNTELVMNGFNDSRIVYIRKQNGERGAARNYGRERARGSYVNFFDSDDLMYPHHLQVAFDFVLSNSNPEIFHLGYDFKTPDGEVTKRVNQLSNESIDTILFDNILSCNGVILRKDIANRFPFHEDRKLASAEDWELWIRLISRYTLIFNNRITTSVISHDQRSIRTITIDKLISRDTLLIAKLKEDHLVMKKYGKKFSQFIAQRYTYIMLGLAAEKSRWQVIKCAVRAFVVYPPIIFTKRFLASLKNML